MNNIFRTAVCILILINCSFICKCLNLTLYKENDVYDYIIIGGERFIENKLVNQLLFKNSKSKIHIIDDIEKVKPYLNCTKTIYYFITMNNCSIKTINFDILHSIITSNTVMNFIYIDISCNELKLFYLIERKYKDILKINQKINFKALHFENIYGPGMSLNTYQILPSLIKQSLSKLSNTLVLKDSGFHNFIYLDNVIDILIHASNIEYNISSKVMNSKPFLTTTMIGIAQIISKISYIVMDRRIIPCLDNSNGILSKPYDYDYYWTTELFISFTKTYVDLSYRLGALQLDIPISNDEIIGEYGYLTPNLISWLNNNKSYHNIENSARYIEFINQIKINSTIKLDTKVKCSKDQIITLTSQNKKKLIFHHVPETIDPLKELPYYHAYIPYFNDTYEICYCKLFNIRLCTDCFGNNNNNVIIPDVHLMGQSIISHSLKLNVKDILKLKVKCRAMFLNKEYKALSTKLEFIKQIKPNIVFTHQHDLKYFVKNTGVPFARIPFATIVTDFNHYANISSNEIPYEIDISTSGNNFRVPWRLWYNNTGIQLLQQYGIRATVTGYVASAKEYLKNIIISKMWISTLSEADILTVRVFDIMATNRTLLFMNQPTDHRILRGVFTNKHVVLFKSDEDFIKKVIYYSTHEQERLTMVNDAYDLAVNYHHWEARAKLMKKIINDC